NSSVTSSRQKYSAELAVLLESRRRRRRSRLRRRRGRAALVVAALAVCISLGLVVAGFTTAEAVLGSCSLSSLKPIPIGQTSFLYAADGSVLGSIPAERHRQPVGLRHVSFWMKEATVAIE